MSQWRERVSERVKKRPGKRMRGTALSLPLTFLDKAKGGEGGVPQTGGSRIFRKERETYRIDMPLQRFPLFLVLLFSPSSFILAIARRNSLQTGEALIVQDIDAAVVRPEVVDLLVEQGDPDVFADEFDELEDVGGCGSGLLLLLLGG